MDGFEYDRFSAATTNAGPRVEWIKKQVCKTGEFFPQPYEQLIKVLRDMGHEGDARKVAISKQENLRRSGALNWKEWLWNWFLGALIGHGYQPWKALIPIAVFLILGAGLFYVAGNVQYLNVMVPGKERVYFDANYKICKGRIGVTKDCWPEYSTLNSLVYSIDVFVPFVDLKQEQFWLPDQTTTAGKLRWAYLWLHIAAGWFLTTIFVVGLTGIVKQDKV